MLFILHNNVALSLFLRAFDYIFYTVFCTGYTYFLHILYIFYTYFIHFSHYFLPFLHKNNALLVRYWLNIIHFRAFFSTLPCVFPSISYNFLYIYTNIACISMHTRTILRFASFFIFCTFVQTFSTHCTKIALAKCHSLYKLFGTFAQTFSSLPPHFSSLWETLWQFVSSFLARLHSFPQLFLMRLQLFPSATILFLLLFPFVMFLFLQRFSLISFMLLQCFSFITLISP